MIGSEEKGNMMTYTEFIKNHKTHYEIVKLKQQGKTYKEIAYDTNLSAGRVIQKYYQFLYKLNKCYCCYLNSIKIEINLYDIMNFYENPALSAAYLEENYQAYLNTFRVGEPVMFGYYKDFPDYRKLSDAQILTLEKQILEAKECQNKNFTVIGKELDLSKEKAKCIYDHYYRKKVLSAIDRIQPMVNFSYSGYVFHYSHTERKRWQLILSEYAELLQDLMD